MTDHYGQVPTYARVPGGPYDELSAVNLFAERNRIARECADAHDENADLTQRIELLENQQAALELDRAHILGVVGDYLAAFDGPAPTDDSYDWDRLAEARLNLRRLLLDKDTYADDSTDL